MTQRDVMMCKNNEERRDWRESMSRVCLPGLKCIWLKSSCFCVCKDTHIDAQRKFFLETFHNHLCTYLPLRVPLRPPVGRVLPLAISQALPLCIYNILHVNSPSFLVSFLLSRLPPPSPPHRSFPLCQAQHSKTR